MKTERMMKLKESMKSQGIDSLILVPGPNLYYFSGLKMHTSERSTMLFVNAGAKDCIFLPKLEMPNATSILKDEYAYYSYSYEEGPDQVFGGMSKALGLSGRKIGVKILHIVPGSGKSVLCVGTRLLGVINLQGRAFLPPIDCPFRSADRELAELAQVTDTVLVDFHGEATAEKQAFGWYVDGRVSAVLGTHTHVQTADERILPGRTAYITDVGMTGPRDSVIGIRPEDAVTKFLTRCPGSSLSPTDRRSCAPCWSTSRTPDEPARFSVFSSWMTNGSFTQVAARIIDGKRIAAGVRNEIREVQRFRREHCGVPGLAVIRVAFRKFIEFRL